MIYIRFKILSLFFVSASKVFALREIDDLLEGIIRLVLRVLFGAHVDVSSLVVHDVGILFEVVTARLVSLSRSSLDENRPVSLHVFKLVVFGLDECTFGNLLVDEFLLVFTTNLTLILHELDALLVILLFELLNPLSLLHVLLVDVLLEGLFEVAESLSFAGKLSPDDRRKLGDLRPLSLDLRSARQNLGDDGFVVDLFVSELGCWWHDEEFHGLPKIQMQVLIAHGDKPDDLLAPYVPDYESTRVHVAVDDDLGESLGSLAYEMHRLIINRHISMWDVPEFHPLI